MKKFILGAAIGAGIGVALGYLAAKAQENGYFDEICDKADEMALKTKEKAKETWESGKNKAGHILEQTGEAIKKGRSKIAKVIEP